MPSCYYKISFLLKKMFSYGLKTTPLNILSNVFFYFFAFNLKYRHFTRVYGKHKCVCMAFTKKILFFAYNFHQMKQKCLSGISRRAGLCIGFIQQITGILWGSSWNSIVILNVLLVIMDCFTLEGNHLSICRVLIKKLENIYLLHYKLYFWC